MRRSVFIAAAMLWTTSAFANETAEQIARFALDNNMFSTDNSRATIDMEIARDGKVVRQRKISALVKRKEGLVTSFVEFVDPADVAGTKFLSVEVAPGETQQFIYLPAFKKTKRVVGAQRGTSFMGTDFSYSDLEGRDVNKTSWKRLPDEKVQGEDCWVIEGVPKKPEDETYGRSVIWVHKGNKLPLKSDFYDKDKTTLTKKMVVNKLSQKDGKWIMTDAVMQTVAKNSETRLRVTSIDLKTPIPDEALSREALEK